MAMDEDDRAVDPAPWLTARAVLKILGIAALGAFAVACARVDLNAHYEAEAAKGPPRWTDANRWE